jgi:hypothetical protein
MAMGYAVCEYSSFGVNLSELLNSFKIIITADNDSSTDSIVKDLCTSAEDFYRSRNHPAAILLCDKTYKVPEDSGFEYKKDYYCWNLISRHAHLFQTYFEELLQNRRSPGRLEEQKAA